MYVIPAPGLRIFDPERLQTPEAQLPPEGREVPDTEYWRRRVMDGDVSIGSPPGA